MKTKESYSKIGKSQRKTCWRLTFDGKDELRNDGQDLVPPTSQQVPNARSAEEVIRMGRLSQAIEEERKIMVIVQLFYVNLQYH